ncbi:tRNA (adenosine(37)-N6)-threonylcarbamoyltransferase complex ATPase subunit type 1 TsaE [Fictibacillus phosphorivorans]|uniref:tRNA (adenosine(37)-N6)-threonylcarbamoyltransferase complex ATPase subunit type 1 TsaE n=1 Tax=Fictibacillus phosphorivorans TaxID=1221500 RepID=UPI001292EF8A|nr:tRNA (adenosine(37)-N6)-threonylcarbamoyltransferase complex ATPase subunit type 1 TsaE [Fictibacillus phosphorivorans]MQR93647.1 tRNA (adenosine(37)-N6)-threonylcarbamoyltransferase complex ATPase subunit type 1 TsaE [Fictibacillus phosphorivorans]
MSTYQYETKSAEETMSFAEKLGSLLQKGDVLTLAGDLGAGKTTFTKGLAKGLGVTRTVNSPTFTIIKEYSGRLPLYHMDVYRLEDSDEDLGFEEYFSGDGVCVVEWAVFIEDYLPEERLELVISHKGDDEREIQLRPIGSRYEERVKEIM